MISETKIQEIGADYLIIESDISNEDAVRGIYAAVQERYERINILVNNAAVSAIVLNGCYYQFPVSHESLVSCFDQTPVPRQQGYAYTFLYSWPKGIAIGTHIVPDNLLVADAV